MTKVQLINNILAELRACKEERKGNDLNRREKLMIDGRIEGLRFAIALINTLSA